MRDPAFSREPVTCPACGVDHLVELAHIVAFDEGDGPDEEITCDLCHVLCTSGAIVSRGVDIAPVDVPRLALRLRPEAYLLPGPLYRDPWDRGRGLRFADRDRQSASRPATADENPPAS